jgi:hypothetical protein
MLLIGLESSRSPHQCLIGLYFQCGRPKSETSALALRRRSRRAPAADGRASALESPTAPPVLGLARGTRVRVRRNRITRLGAAREPGIHSQWIAALRCGPARPGSSPRHRFLFCDWPGGTGRALISLTSPGLAQPFTKDEYFQPRPPGTPSSRRRAPFVGAPGRILPRSPPVARFGALRPGERDLHLRARPFV